MANIIGTGGQLRRNTHRHLDRFGHRALAIWPRLLDLHLAATYCSVGERTVEGWVHERIIEPVPMPGSILKDKNGNVIASASRRRIAKILIDKADLDALIDQRKVGI